MTRASKAPIASLGFRHVGRHRRGEHRIVEHDLELEHARDRERDEDEGEHPEPP